ncbi:HAD hydrolase-like protein [Actinokineospora sp.]|uniref:HAD hydrolase-like protein n=1 Tax=Actinokineospora sp. TaxID=1872133 RepID=UPI0040382091
MTEQTRLRAADDPAAPTTLVLWDIDLTLVDYSGIGRRWYGEALATVLGIELAHVPAFPGRTERSITVELLEAHGVERTEEHIQRMFAELIAIATAARHDLHTLGRPLPGATEILGVLAERPDVVQSLVTGNLPELADCKLTPFGLDRHLDFEVGGYGSLSIDRHELVSAAMAAAGAKYRTRFAPDRVVVIGDTPHDVAAALHHGAVGVGVATGRHSAAELADAGAHLVLRDLSDTAAVLDALIGCTGSGDRVNAHQLPSGA